MNACAGGEGTEMGLSDREGEELMSDEAEDSLALAGLGAQRDGTIEVGNPPGGADLEEERNRTEKAVLMKTESLRGKRDMSWFLGPLCKIGFCDEIDVKL